MSVAAEQSSVVHKFGGAALADGDAIHHAADIVQHHGPAPSVIVVSAIAGVTDTLLSLCSAESEATVDVEAVLEELRTRHIAALVPVVGGLECDDALHEIHRAFEPLSQLLAHVRQDGRLDPVRSALVLAMGERLSACVLVAHLRSRGVMAEYTDASEVVATCGDALNAIPDLDSVRAPLSVHFWHAGNVR